MFNDVSFDWKNNEKLATFCDEGNYFFQICVLRKQIFYKTVQREWYVCAYLSGIVPRFPLTAVKDQLGPSRQT